MILTEYPWSFVVSTFGFSEVGETPKFEILEIGSLSSVALRMLGILAPVIGVTDIFYLLKKE